MKAFEPFLEHPLVPLGGEHQGLRMGSAAAQPMLRQEQRELVEVRSAHRGRRPETVRGHAHAQLTTGARPGRGGNQVERHPAGRVGPPAIEFVGEVGQPGQRR